MSKVRRARSSVIPVILVCALLVAGSALAQSAEPYDLSWNSFDGGGFMFSTGSPYVLGGTAGQGDAGLMLGGGYSLVGGFWGRGMIPVRVYVPIVLRVGP
jgi:hypothetical protein